jgi:2-oxo-3-hexenedioate decarboxylase/2-keto-4-pentenoate hydratase
MRDEQLAAAAELLARARQAPEPFDSLPESCRPKDETEAYQTQDHLHRQLKAELATTLIGRKIGCTTDVMQRYLGIDNPAAGGLFEGSVHATPAYLDHGGFKCVGVECEIAVRLSDSLPATAVPYDRDNVSKAVATCMAAIEIVDDRYVDYGSLDTPTLIADDFFNAGAVLGPEVKDWRCLDLAGLKGRMAVDGEIVGEGLGAAILGHPFEALAWLANSLNGRDQYLRAGDLILLGSLVQTQWVGKGQTVEITIDDLGTATVHFA